MAKTLRNLKITKVVYGGAGLARHEGKAVFVRYTAPEDTVDATVTKETKSFIYAQLKRVISPSRHRQKPSCPVFQTCGGCDFLHIKYAAQMLIKQEMMREIFHKQTAALKPITPSPLKQHYRNKAQLPYRNGKLGFFMRETHNIVPITDCYITDPLINSAIARIQQLLTKYSISSYEESSGKGYVRNVVLRKSNLLNKLLIIFVINSSKVKNKLRQLVNELKQEPYVFSIFANVNKENTNVILAKKFIPLYGEEFFAERILDLNITLFPGSFVQINLAQAENIYKKALELLQPTKDDRIFDAYCGPGVLSLLVAQRVKTVYGVDLSADAIKSAIASARLNNVKNARFFTASAEAVDADKLNTFTKAIVNPPRSGLSPQTAAKFNHSNLERIIYISCNPQTLKRDIERMPNYTLKALYPFDMFPHTYHIESVALLARK